MAKRAAADEPEEAQGHVLAQDVNLKGVPHSAGDTVHLTSDEHEACVAAGVQFEGDEKPTAEDVQAKHDEAAEAFRQEVKERPIRDKEEEQKAREEQLRAQREALETEPDEL